MKLREVEHKTCHRFVIFFRVYLVVYLAFQQGKHNIKNENRLSKNIQIALSESKEKS